MSIISLITEDNSKILTVSKKSVLKLRSFSDCGATCWLTTETGQLSTEEQ